MRIAPLSAAMLAVLIATPALAQEAASGRYAMTPTAEGMLRLDTRTGEVSLCSNATGTWTCRSVPDDRIALDDEIDRLNAENRRLRARPGEPGGEGADKPGLKNRGTEMPRSWLPTDREIAEFKTFFEKMMRELKALMEPRQEEKPEKRL